MLSIVFLDKTAQLLFYCTRLSVGSKTHYFIGLISTIVLIQKKDEFLTPRTNMHNLALEVEKENKHAT